MEPDATYRWDSPDGYDFFETTRLLRTGGNDPTVRRVQEGLWRAARLPEGPVTVRITVDAGASIAVRAWGEGANSAGPYVRRWLGLEEPAWCLPDHPVTNRLLHEHPGIRLNDTGDVFEGLVTTILQQQVTWQEAAFTWRRLVEELGEVAPGPRELRLAPTPRAVRSVSVDRLMLLGIGRQRAKTIQEVAFSAKGLQRAAELPTDEAMSLLQHVRGVGPWTAAFVLGLRLARPEPIVRGDLKLPHAVCWALAGEPRGDDERMAELLAPFPGQGFQVIRLIYAARIEAPRRSHKREIRFGFLR
ncbi:MAG: hypothetical protein QNJ00_15610 [Woeseiaceae bacterium]|nr:hypothetical protein [Woeseiaceae bacterium]